MKMNVHTKRGLVLWLIALVIFGVASAVGYTQGNAVVLHVANRFHAVRCAEYVAEKNYGKAIKEYKAWLWLDPTHVERTLTLTELHLLQHEPFEAWNRLTPLIEAMDEDDFDLCRMMTKVRMAQGNADAVAWAQRTLAMASEGQQAEVKQLVLDAQARLKGVESSQK
jgi:hypothetical protein